MYCSITIKGQLDRHWSEWFDGLAIISLANGTTVLAGHLQDQAALHGMLTKVRDLSLSLVSLQCEDRERTSRGPEVECARHSGSMTKGRIMAARIQQQVSSLREINNEKTRAHIVALDELPRSGNTYRFEGYKHGDPPVSLLVDTEAPGSGPRLHRHPLYAEVIVVQEGQATFTLNGETLEVTDGHIVVVPPGMPHRFINAGDGPLRLVAIHLGARIVTEWLEE